MRRLLCALLALLLLLGDAAAEAERLWLHGDFETVETDGYRLQNGFYEYEKIAHKGDISLYAVGYGEESGYALITPEDAGGDLTYERMEDADLGAAQAGRGVERDRRASCETSCADQVCTSGVGDAQVDRPRRRGRDRVAKLSAERGVLLRNLCECHWIVF